jgi:UDP-2,4-diacetamido-2,4,6-trideoxy-beta-L-altropyranose hydrolase
MLVTFRTDASLQMGSGHVMRCLTLADALTAQGAQCHFICREHPGHLMEMIRQRGFKVNSLAGLINIAISAPKIIANEWAALPPGPAHAAWLGSTWQADAADTASILATLKPDWLVVDHYALEARWEEALAPHYQKLLVIDDLADRPHACDLLLDQNLGRQPGDYEGLVPAQCQMLTGPRYALLRPEFAALREASLKRRAGSSQKEIKQLLITMGGVDLPNATGQVLEALKGCPLPADCCITVVMGATAPALAQVRELAGQMPWPTTVLVDVSNMAQHMARSDLAIGAAGSTSWERCCMGLPTLMVVLAENQRPIAIALERAGAAVVINRQSDIQLASELTNAIGSFLVNEKLLASLGTSALGITNGCGVNLVVAQMLGKKAS